MQHFWHGVTTANVRNHKWGQIIMWTEQWQLRAFDSNIYGTANLTCTEMHLQRHTSGNFESKLDRNIHQQSYFGSISLLWRRATDGLEFFIEQHWTCELATATNYHPPLCRRQADNNSHQCLTLQLEYHSVERIPPWRPLMLHYCYYY